MDCQWNYNCDIAADTPMFFKIILQNTITQGKIEIPSGFVTKFGNCLKSPIMFMIPDGNTWQLELSKVGEKVWFEKGWKEFAEHYSLQHGHLLVFKYEPISHFNVFIFDMSAVEFEYPGSAIHSGQSYKDSKSQFSMNKNEEINTLISDNPMPNLKSLSKDENNLRIHEFGGNVACSSEAVGIHGSDINFNPSNLWFKVVLKSSYIKQRYMAIPYIFVEKHMESAAQIVMLKVEDKSWPVKLNVYLGSKGGRCAGLYGGFRSFLTENSLKKGDACVFEMINKGIFNVSIFRM